MKHHNYYVYITTNTEKKVIYTGVTNNLAQRLIEHYLNRGKPQTFAGRYYCFHLIFYERFLSIEEAIRREKEIKGWRREKKLVLIATQNPTWKVFNIEIVGEWPPKEVYKRGE